MIPPQILQLLDILSPVLLPVWEILKSWWWLPLPFILWQPFIFLYLWSRQQMFSDKQNFIMLEIKIPQEVLKPVRAMETVMAALRQSIFQPPDFWEKWVDGQYQISYSFEIASIDGTPHFFIRIPEGLKDSVEAIIYSQYPDVEISVAEDYTKNVPQDIPNDDWDIWAADYKLLKPESYPIKTYLEFESEREAKEEKRVDPLSGLLEAMTKVKTGEQLWIQIITEPVSPLESDWIKDGEKLRDELAKRIPKPMKRKPMVFEAVDVLVTGEPAPEPKTEKADNLFPEMQLTPGERDIVSAIEKKMAKPGMRTNIRFIWLGKKDVFNKGNLRLPFGYFASYSTENLNYLIPWGKTMTKVHKSWFLPLNKLFKRRLYLKKRKIFRNYVGRRKPLFPLKGGTYVLNIEELASLYHFPGKSMAPSPTLSRIQSKKSEAPPNLPID